MVENYGVSHLDSLELEKNNKNLDNFDIRKYMDEIWEKIQDLDKKIQEKEPYKLFKTDKDFAIDIVSDLCTDLSIIANMLIPAMPETSKKILNLLKKFEKPKQPLFLRKE
ncbi:MAG: Methionine-tRNA ligase [Parcubacteria group bacterium GW2011_GWC1_35_21]|nr:MAG: Methionine-tRNA ligase [Parcubacteria group bacterium GW2011_GWC1_35_21]